MNTTQRADRMLDTGRGGCREIAAFRRPHAFGFEWILAEISDLELLTPLASDCAMVDR